MQAPELAVSEIIICNLQRKSEDLGQVGNRAEIREKKEASKKGKKELLWEALNAIELSCWRTLLP